MLLFFSSLLLAQEIILSDEEEQNIRREENNLYSQWELLTEEEHLFQIRELQKFGRYDSALQRLEFLQSREDSILVQFEIGRTKELMGDFQEALKIYEQLLGNGVSENIQLDLLFRRALVLSDVGNHKQAIKILRVLPKQYELSKSDLFAVQLALGTSELMAGKRRKGVRKIEQSLESIEGLRQFSWLQARARYALAGELLRQASCIRLMTNNKPEKLNQRLQDRANLILAAEKQIAVIIQLDEPEYALQGLVDVADSMLILYDDLIAVPPPKSFTPEQAQFFRDSMAEEASVLQQKAYSYYSKGLRYAE